MATKADQFKADQQRAAHGGPGKRGGARGRKAAHRAPEPRPSHNAAARAARNSSYELEATAPSKRPSRKQSRKSPTHIKTDSALRITAMQRTASPKARAARG